MTLRNLPLKRHIDGYALPTLLFTLVLTSLIVGTIQSSTHHLIDFSRQLESYSRDLSYSTPTLQPEGLRCTNQSPQLCWLERQQYYPLTPSGQLTANKLRQLPSLNALSQLPGACPTTPRIEVNLPSDGSSQRTCVTDSLSLTSSSAFSSNLLVNTLVLNGEPSEHVYLFVAGDLLINSLTTSRHLTIVSFGRTEIDTVSCQSIHLVSLTSTVRVKVSNNCESAVLATNIKDSSAYSFSTTELPIMRDVFPQPLWISP